MKLPRGLRTSLFVIVALLLVLVSLLMWFEEKLIYFPSRPLDGTPEDIGLAYEDVQLEASDGVRVHGWFFEAEGGRTRERSVVLMCHGNAGNISDRLERARLVLSKLSVDMLMFDYRGYGRSEGSPTEEGTYRDARAAYRYLVETRHVAPERIVLFGESLGAAVALQLALEVPAAALVLEAPFTSIPDMARVVYPFLPFADKLRTRYDSLSKISRLRVPLLIVHFEEDPTVPFAMGKALFETAPGPKAFLQVPGRGHTEFYELAGERYWLSWRELLEKAKPSLR